MGICVCLYFHKENGIWVNGTGNHKLKMKMELGIGRKESWKVGLFLARTI